MKNKEALLNNLFNCTVPEDLQDLWGRLDIYEWRKENKLSPTIQQVTAVLERYLAGELSEQQVEDWANFIEAADIALGGFDDERAMDAIQNLANPALEGPLTHESAQALIAQLSGKNLDSHVTEENVAGE